MESVPVRTLSRRHLRWAQFALAASLGLAGAGLFSGEDSAPAPETDWRERIESDWLLKAKYPASTRAVRAEVAQIPAIVKDAGRYVTVARNEDAALAVLELINGDIARAARIHDAVRLAVIDGEFQ